MCSCDSGDPPRVFERTMRKARGGYPCCECARRIQHGEWYEECRGMWEDAGWDTFRTCMKCAARRSAFALIEGCHPPIEELSETIIECIREGDVTRDEYLRALRASRAQLHGEIHLLEQQRAERYAEAGRQRELAKWRAAHLGEGI